MKRKDNWLKLDNAAKVFPYISNMHTSNVFRLSYILKENIDPLILQKAVDDIKDRFPTFFVKMKKGFFWYYFEKNENKFIVQEETPYVCKYKKANDGYFIEIFYFKKRLSLEVFHSIADASGATQLLNSICYRYLELKGYLVSNDDKAIIEKDTEIRTLELEDSFNKYYSATKNSRITPKKAYRIKGDKFYILGNGVITGTTDVAKLKAIAKSFNATITEFLTAVLMKSIIQYAKTAKKPINIFVPVNLRRFFDSETLRNFSLFVYVSKNIKDYDLEDLIKDIKEDFKSQLTLTNMQTTLDANVKLEKDYALRFCPLFLKWIIFKLGYQAIAGGLETMSLSNLGEVKMPNSLKKYVESAEFIIGAGEDSTNNLGVVSLNNKICLSFSRTIMETEIEKNFFRSLHQFGLDFKIDSNLWEEN